MPPPSSLPPGSALEVLSRWNSWGTAKLAPGFPRDVIASVERFLDTPELVALIGPRRAGKTTALFQVMRLLEARGVPPQARLHINFEEPALGPELGPELLERLYRSFRTEVYPRGRAYLFLDEVQNVPGWERWVRARQDTEDLKVFVTGSSANLLSRELATLLTGRHVTFRVLPLSFAEFLRFRFLDLPAAPRLAGNPPELENALLSYLRWGGFPEVVLALDDDRRETLLRQYFDDVLFKDVAIRHQIRDLSTLRNIAVHLLGQTASLVTYKRVASVFSVSLDLARTYCGYLQEAFLVSFVPFWSLKTAERLRRPQKVHAIDLGVRNAVSLTASADRGHLAETAVYNALSSGTEGGLFYWQGQGEVDVVVRQGNEVTGLVQVVFGSVERSDLLERELRALAEGAARFPGAAKVLVVGMNSPELPDVVRDGTSVVPLWRFLASSTERRDPAIRQQDVEHEP